MTGETTSEKPRDSYRYSRHRHDPLPRWLAGAALAVAAFVAVWMWDTNAGTAADDVRIGTMQATITKLEAQQAGMVDTLRDLNAALAADEKQDKTLSKHWRLHTWAKEEINAVRFILQQHHPAERIPQVRWPPDLGD